MTAVKPPLASTCWQVAPRPERSGGEFERQAAADCREDPPEPRQQSAAIILVPLDLNGFSQPAVDFALWLAARLEAELMLLHVMERPCPGGLLCSSGRRSLPDAVTRRAWQALQALAESPRQRGIRLQCVVREGVPAFEILRLAEMLHVTLIVLGRSARGPLNRLVFGSVVGEIVEASRCPVLVVPTPAHPPGLGSTHSAKNVGGNRHPDGSGTPRTTGGSARSRRGPASGVAR